MTEPLTDPTERALATIETMERFVIATMLHLDDGDVQSAKNMLVEASREASSTTATLVKSQALSDRLSAVASARLHKAIDIVDRYSPRPERAEVGTIYRHSDGDLFVLARYEVSLADEMSHRSSDDAPESPSYNYMSRRGGAASGVPLPEGTKVAWAPRRLPP